MSRMLQSYASQANRKLIAQAAGYYNDAKENLAFYREIDSPALQKLSREHLMHWKKELRSLIFSGMNCTGR